MHMFERRPFDCTATPKARSTLHVFYMGLWVLGSFFITCLVCKKNSATKASKLKITSKTLKPSNPQTLSKTCVMGSKPYKFFKIPNYFISSSCLLSLINSTFIWVKSVHFLSTPFLLIGNILTWPVALNNYFKHLVKMYQETLLIW